MLSTKGKGKERTRDFSYWRDPLSDCNRDIKALTEHLKTLNLLK